MKELLSGEKLDSKQLKIYKESRKQGSSPYSALCHARQGEPKYDIEWTDRKASLEIGKMHIYINTEYDDIGDNSFIGKFSDKEEEGFIKRYNPGRGEYKYFIPATTITEHRRALSKMGYARGPAEELARSYVYRDKKRLEEYSDYWSYVFLDIKVFFNGTEIATASLGGIEDDSGEDYFTQIACDLIDEALIEANKWMEDMRRELCNDKR